MRPLDILHKKSTSSKEAILDAAAALVCEQGASALTLDATCARAGMSKGGLLYHFRTKEDLLLALVRRQHDCMMSSIQACYEGEDNPAPGRWHRAAIRSFFRIFQDSDNRVFSLMASIGQQVMATEGAQAESFRELMREQRCAIRELNKSDGLSPMDGELIESCLHGLIVRRLKGEEILPSVLDQLQSFLLSRAGVPLPQGQTIPDHPTSMEMA
jgi:AcrR family transcriptional regulator